MVQWRNLVNTVINLGFREMMGNFSLRDSFSRKTLLHEDIITDRGLFICDNEQISSATKKIDFLSGIFVECSNIIVPFSVRKVLSSNFCPGTGYPD
jgi:hypothetical protein